MHILWQRGKKIVKTKVKNLQPDNKELNFNENIQVNTVLEISKSTGKPLKEKMSKLTVIWD